MTNFLRLCIVALLCGLVAFPATAQNKTDKNGKKQGEWVKKYPNGNTMYEGSFKDDEPVGTFKRYYENGMLKSVQVYETGDISSVKLYSQDSKTVIAEGNFRGKAKHGMWKLYKDGKLLTEEVYKDDKKHGMTKTYSDGNVIEEIPYNEGKIDGVHRYFLPNGKLYSETSYKNGIKDGAYKVYEGNSSPVIFGTYKKGKKDGDWTSLDEKGNVSEVLKYKDGVLTNKKEINKERNRRFEERERSKGTILEPNEVLGVEVQSK